MDADAEKTFAETFESFGGNQTTTLVLGDASGVADSELDELKRRRVASVALGPKVLLASHCIVLAHAAMDRASHASCVDAERRTDGPTDRRTDGNRQPAA
jgi:16S rRNA U1498 N3-methylase RsmE